MRENYDPVRVVVLGGGYAGTVAANRLCRGPDLHLTLVNARSTFVERIRLHQHVLGTGTATVDYATLLGDGVNLVVDRATRIDAAARRVELASGAALDYDHLVYAVGSTGAVPVAVPGAVEHAHSPAELEGARALTAALGDARSGAVVVVGGGLTGIEMAAELAEQGRTVIVVSAGGLAPSLSARGRRGVARWLSAHGVTVHDRARVVEVRADAVVLADGTAVPSACTVWAVGFGVPTLATDSGLRTDPAGRLLTDETLTSVDDKRIVAAGDSAAPSGHPLRMSCQAAIPMGAQAADTVLSRIAGTTPAPIDQAFTGSCVSLGRRAGTIQLARRDDTPVEAAIGGRPGASIKEMVCRATVWTLRREARKPGSAFWFSGGARPEQRRPLDA